MKNLNNSFAQIFTIAILTGTTFLGHAADINSRNPAQSLPQSIGFTIPESVSHLIALGDHYAQLGQAEFALEHYSRSIRVGKLSDPNYTNQATQDKIVALITQMSEVQTQNEIEELIAQGNRAVTENPQQALEYYSRSIRVGKLHNDKYADGATQQKIVKLVTVLGEKVAQAK
ncbi:hypothetical protein [Tunicatimonas pelagia]|uniref:hypothetical protein n=1 Tax=Tunicatimonas pelagia TaxID=931531 RepID=UPI002664E659|nr:hypothetical protein [Tunicatimonas pelagia]WKN43343.1 hypothetical protein P0M28_30325 [Tunicatimonas pelagia]